ncbi:MAG: FAD-dependent oxidoreductase [Planctomycetaceae bacterium]|nr:FAD-dependent oxidoreductase [Planctomycetaceae bacterium]
MSVRRRTFGIIGGGAIGWSVAYQLAKTRRRTDESIVVFDASLAGASSWAGAGILPPATRFESTDPMEQLQKLSREAMPLWSRELKQLSGIDNEFHVCGGVYVAQTSGEHASLIGLRQFWDEMGIEGLPLEADSWNQRFPWFANQIPREKCRLIFEVPGEAQLRNPRHLAALRRACEVLGVETRALTTEQAARLQLSASATGPPTLEWGASESWNCEQFVLATGSWTSALLRRWFGTTDRFADVFPIKGEMLLFDATTPLFSTIFNVGTRYIVPRLDGHILVGSTEQEAGFFAEPTEEGRSQLLEFVEQTLPDLLRFKLVKHWAGLRPASFDQMPIIGRLNQCPDLIVASGHFRSGLQWSIGTALCVAALLRHELPPLDLRVFQPSR